MNDAGYRRFLSKLADPLMARLAPGARGLDYGCGPGPALAAMLREAGHEVALYDPFFAPDPAPLSGATISSPAPRRPSISTARRRNSTACAHWCGRAAGWR